MIEKNLIKREDYKIFYPITTRWMDNDLYGHINNAVYYSCFDSVVNRFLIENCNYRINIYQTGFYVVYSNCNFISSISFPEEIEVGLVVKKIGNSSITYGVSIFKKNQNDVAAYGDFVHVFVDRIKNKSLTIPKDIRKSIEFIKK